MRTRLSAKLQPLLVRLLLLAGSVTLCTQSATAADSFPRLMGMNIGAKNYEDPGYLKQLARLDIVILGFYKEWQPRGYAPTPALAMRRVVQELKQRHPGMLVGQYTILSEAYDDPKDVATADLRDKLNENDWWLRNAAGEKVQWTSSYSSWETNLTAWARPDAQGRRWPQWLAERNFEVFFRDIPEFDIVYLDGVMATPRVRGSWKQDGRNARPDDPSIQAAHRAGHVEHWNRIRQLQPKAMLMGNLDNDISNAEWRGQLEGAFLEGLIGEHWSIERRAGWAKMMERYRAALQNTRAPHIVGFNVSGALEDYRAFRYAFTSCLLDDGYFAFTDKARGFSSVAWFDEYGYRLGSAQSPPPVRAWKEGVWRRDFENGIVLVNPGTESKTIALEPGLRRLRGSQDPAVNDGSAVDQLTLRSRDGIVLRR